MATELNDWNTFQQGRRTQSITAFMRLEFHQNDSMISARQASTAMAVAGTAIAAFASRKVWSFGFGFSGVEWRPFVSQQPEFHWNVSHQKGRF